MTLIQGLKWESVYTLIWIEVQIGRCRIALMYDWRDGWLGWFFDPERHRLYILFLPMLGFRITLMEKTP